MTEHAPATVTCRTQGCPNEGIPIEMVLYGMNDEPIETVSCGPCGQEITDIQRPPESSPRGGDQQ